MWGIVIAGCTALIASAVAFAVSQQSGRSFNEATLCTGDGADHVTVVLLDLTDPLSATQASRLGTMLDREIATSADDTMMSFGIVSDDDSEWGARFARCKPPTGADANELYENPRLIAERYREEFEAPLEATLFEMIRASEADRSPIMEALQALIAETPDFISTPGERKIMIVSDMLQHSDTLSAYRDQGWEHFEASGQSSRLAGNLENADVRIIRIPRQTNADVAISEDFWVRYFDKQGSNLPSVTVLGDL
ncbi:hypothetical protein [Rhodosalinus sediminis]|uniref:hypothetical protein n=1 Tax=Rhodosalinus sediminis TaxID=1940533 RepID=UPI0011C05C70|nr:hypothetical protein [Rhodosalinus sediminis]